jgi:hypothetical protein
MIRPFKFLKNPLLITVDGKSIYPNILFYSMNKQDIILPNKITPKYTIVIRCIDPIYEDVFKPDYDTLLYFSTRESAEFYKSRLIHWDEHVVGGEVFHEQSDLTLTFRR